MAFRGSDIRLRTARWPDLERVTSIDHEAKEGKGWPRSWFENELIRPFSRFLVAEKQSRVIAFCVWWQTHEQIEILNVAVAPTHQRQGVASFLFDRVMFGSQRTHVERVDLELRSNNNAAMAFYQKYQFAPVGRRPSYYRDGCDAILMRRQLR